MADKKKSKLKVVGKKSKPAKTVKKQGNQFQPGVSGNPQGRPEGSRNKATLALQTLLEDEGEVITKKAIQLAKEGDLVAIRIVMDRLISPRKDRPVSLELPKLESLEDITKVMSSISESVGKGEITPMEGQAITSIVEVHRKAIESLELEKRITELEKSQPAKNNKRNF